MASKSQSYLQEIITGLFVVAVVALLGFFTIVISGVDILRGHRNLQRLVRFENVGSLKVQDPVYVRGLKVGSVQDMELERNAVLVTLSVSSDVEFHEDYAITIASTSVFGGGCIEIKEGTKGEPADPEVVLEGTSPTPIMEEVQELVGQLRKALNPEELAQTLTNINTATSDIAIVMGRIREGKGMIGHLVSDEDASFNDLTATLANIRKVTDSLANGQGLLGKLLQEDNAVYADLQSSVANIRQVTDALANGEGLLGKLINSDDATYADLQATMANLRAITAKVNDPGNGIGRLLSSDSTLVSDLEATASNLKSITAKLDNGEGTLGKLVSDDGIATELEATVKDVRQIIDNMRDTAPITTFTSLFFSGL